MSFYSPTHMKHLGTFENLFEEMEQGGTIYN